VSKHTSVSIEGPESGILGEEDNGVGSPVTSAQITTFGTGAKQLPRMGLVSVVGRMYVKYLFHEYQAVSSGNEANPANYGSLPPSIKG
jgi:hypothetical protein